MIGGSVLLKSSDKPVRHRLNQVQSNFIRPVRQRTTGGIRHNKILTQEVYSQELFKRVPQVIKDRYKEIVPVLAASFTVVLAIPAVRSMLRSRRG
jgi:hypothetical protein